MVGAILIGGQSSRMGTDKALMKLHGRPVVEIQAERLREVCDRVVLVGRDPAHLAALPSIPGAKALCDAQPGRGPMGGLHAALINAAIEPVLLLGCDLPFVDAPLLRRLAEAFEKNHPLALLPRTPSDGGDWQPEPLCAIWSHQALPKLEAALHSGRLSLFKFAAEIGAEYLDLSAEDSTQLRNVNTRGDLTDGLTF